MSVIGLCPMLILQSLVPDYSLESHQKDHEQFVDVTRNRRRRAKALLDFERHDDDELGFRKNDIITVSVESLKQFYLIHGSLDYCINNVPL